jgi:hypothetical protein
MSTSGVYAFSVTRNDIVRQAMKNVGALDLDEDPTASEVDSCVLVLNMMCKQWMGKSDFAPGLKVWTRKTGYLMLSGTTGFYSVGPDATGWTNSLVRTYLTANAAAAATALTVSSITGVSATYVIGVQLDSGTLHWTTVASTGALTINLTTGLPSAASSGSWCFVYQTAAQRILDIETVVLRDSQNQDTPVRFLNVQDYSYLPSKADTAYRGDPAAIYWEDGRTSSTIYTDVGAAEDVSKYLVLKYLEPVQDFVNPLDEPHYPQEWYLALCWGLSEQIWSMLGASWDEKKEALKNGAMMIARNKGAENSTLYFQPGEE